MLKFIILALIISGLYILGGSALVANVALAVLIAVPVLFIAAIVSTVVFLNKVKKEAAANAA